jgi:Transposase DDE domain
MVLQVRRWMPKRQLVVVGDSSFAVIDLLWQLRRLKEPVAMIVRFRMDAALYEPAKTVQGKKGRPHKKGKRLPTLAKVAEDKRTHWKRLTVQEWYGEKKRKIEITSGTAVWSHAGKPAVPIRWVIVRDPKKRFKTQSLLSTDLTISAEQIVQWFPRRWQVEVTFHETRTHLGVETQRQWADLSILRITPALLSLFSLVTLLANVHARQDNLPIQQTAWYTKKLPTFSDALSTVKQNLYSYLYFQTSPIRPDVQKTQPVRSTYRFSRMTRTFFHVPYG